MKETTFPQRNRQWWLIFIGIVIIFTLSYSQSPLFTSNQNQYFFYGMAKSGFGDLDQDWLYTTGDIVPVFSWLVFMTRIIFQANWTFYLWYLLIFAIYLFSMYGISAHILQWNHSIKNLLLFGTTAIVLHSAALRYCISTLISPDWEYLIEGGVAGQRVLGDVFQPSSFGVLFLLSIYLFLKGKPFLAVIASSVAAIIHPTYLLSAAVLTATYGLIRLYETRKLKEMILLGTLALVLVSGITIYTAINFTGIEPELAVQANDITINYRQPHHMIISNWLDLRVAVKAGLLATALYLISKQRLFWILLIPSIVVVGLTALQAFIQNPSLAMLFPWRFSVILVPLSTIIIAAHLLDRLFIRQSKLRFSNKTLATFAVILFTACTTAGTFKFVSAIKNQQNDPKYEMMTMIGEQYETGQVVVVPLKWQQFRLVTGIPIVVEFKAGPQRADNIVDWYERVQQVDHLYAGLPYGEGCMRWEYLQHAYGATHLVLPNDIEPEPDCMKLVFSSKEYSYYEAVQVQ